MGAVCAIGTVAAFAVGVALMAGSGVQVLIPETGESGLEWIRDVDEAGGAFLVGAWLGILGGILGIVALVGFYDALRRVGAWLILAPILGSVALTLVTISHLIPIALAYELVPGTRLATPRRRPPLRRRLTRSPLSPLSSTTRATSSSGASWCRCMRSRS